MATASLWASRPPPPGCPPLKTHQRLLKRDCGPKPAAGGSIGQPVVLGGERHSQMSRVGVLAFGVSLIALAICEKGLHPSDLRERVLTYHDGQHDLAVRASLAARGNAHRPCRERA